MEIAQIHLGFNNTDIVKFLRQRGNAIATLNFNEVDAIETKIDTYI